MFVCKLCANKLDEYMRFRERCVANDEFLRNALAFFDAGQNSIKLEQQHHEEIKQEHSSHGHSIQQTQQYSVATAPIDFRQIKRSPERVDDDEEEPLEDEPEEDDKTYSCTVCSKSFKIRQHLLIHSHTHVELLQPQQQQPQQLRQEPVTTPEGKPTYSCGKCTKVFINRGNLLNHASECHGQVKNFCCQICNKSFKYNVQLRIHLRTHSGERPHACEICHRGFSQLSNLRSHRKVVSVPESDPPNQTNPPIPQVHSKVKPYKCQLCLKSFTMLDSLTAHSLKCVKDKYRCQLCSKSFAKEGNLIAHLQCHSEGVIEKNFKCEMCPKSFRNKEDWKRHVRVHTGKSLKCREPKHPSNQSSPPSNR